MGGGRIINTVRYADDLVLLAKEEKMLQDMNDKNKCILKMLWNGNECRKKSK
jgi:hypothetical protein